MEDYTILLVLAGPRKGQSYRSAGNNTSKSPLKKKKDILDTTCNLQCSIKKLIILIIQT